MATWANLSQEERDVYLTFENDVRSLAGETQKLFNKYVALQARKVAQIDAILVNLDNNTVVPKTTGLAGASSLDSDADTMQIYSDFENMLTNHNTATKQQRRAKACGQSNVT